MKQYGLRASMIVVLMAFVAGCATTPIEPAMQEAKRQQLTQETITQLMGPMMGQMMEVMIEGMFTIMAKPENAERLATFTKNYYDALIAKGFSKEDALEIVTMTGMPSMPGVQ